jgi:phosphoadenosine phosphosulfate reductase
VVTRAVGRGDHAHARLPAFARRVGRALEAIREATAHGRIGVSFSGGKDSTVLLDLVRRVVPDAPAAFFDSGCELAAIYATVSQYGVATIRPRLTFKDLARYSGWWGYETPVDTECQWPAKQILIDEPSEAFVCRERLSVIALGLRAEESRGRALNAYTRGELYRGTDRTWRCCPLAHWSVSDVWAYLASRDLPYCAAYDAMAALGIPREEQRIGTLLGAIGATHGRHAIVRAIEPDTFRALAAEFPALREVS